MAQVKGFGGYAKRGMNGKLLFIAEAGAVAALIVTN
jgi:hypothetical protein